MLKAIFKSSGYALTNRLPHWRGAYRSALINVRGRAGHALPLLFLLLFLFLAWAYPLSGATVEKADGTVFDNVSELHRSGDYFVFKHKNEQYSINRFKIRQIVDDDGEIVYEKQVCTAEKITTEEGRIRYAFLENGVKVGEGYWKQNGTFVIENEKPVPDGTFREFYAEGDLKREFTIKNGTLHGVCKSYYKSGQLKRESTFHNGKEVGESKLYHESGELKGVSEYKNGKKSGQTELFYPSGKRKAVLHYKNGKLHGLQKMFYKSGTLRSETEYQNGKKHGEMKEYYKSGELRMEGRFKQGKLNGTVTFYRESGSVKKKKRFKNGKVISEG